MLQLKVDKEYLDIGEISVSLVLKSPIFYDNDGSYSYNFPLPATDKNRVILGFPHRIENQESKSKSLQLEIYFSGVLILSGILTVVSATESDYECAIGTGKGEFNFATKDISLTSLNYGEDIILANAYNAYNDIAASYKNTTTKKYPESNWVVFPIRNPNFFDSCGNGQLEAAYKTSHFYQNYWKDHGFDIILVDSNGQAVLNVYTPFVYNSYVLNQIISTFGFSVDFNIFEFDEELNTLVLWNNVPENEISVSYGYFGFPMYMMPPKHIMNLKNHIPEILIQEYITGLKSMFGAVFFINNNQKKITIKLIKDIINSSETEEFGNNMIENPQVVFNTMKGFSLTMLPDENDEYWKDNVKTLEGSNIKSEVIHNLPAVGNVVGDIRLRTDENFWYRWSLDEADNVVKWMPYCINFFEKKESEGDEEKTTIESKISTLLAAPGIMYADTSLINNGRSWVTPIVYQKGKMKSFADTKDNTYNARLLFYRGLQQDSTGHTYPLASSRIAKYSGNVAGAQYELNWDGENGLYAQFWEDYFNWWCNAAKLVKMKKKMSEIEIRNLDFTKKKYINGQNYLLKEIRITLTSNSIKTAEIDAYTCH